MNWRNSPTGSVNLIWREQFGSFASADQATLYAAGVGT